MASISAVSGPNNAEPQSPLLKQLKSTIICSICADVMTDPAIACSKMHTFDVRCIAQWAEYRQTCPECREALRPTFEANRLAIQNLEIYRAGLKQEQEDRIKPAQLPSPAAPLTPSETTLPSRHSPLIEAIQKDDETAVKQCIERGESVNQIDSAGHNPIFYAKTNGVIELLLKAGAKVKHVPNRSPHPEQINRFINVLSTNDLVTAKEMLEQNLVDVNASDAKIDGPLGKKITCHFLRFVLEKKPILMRLLIAAGANTEKTTPDRGDNTTCLFHLSANTTNIEDPVEKIEILLKAGANINAKGSGHCGAKVSVSVIALRKGSPQVTRLFLQKGADVNMYDDEGRTTLHNACEEKDLEKVRILVEGGANVNLPINSHIKEREGRTPLCIAARQGSIPIMQFLIDNGALFSDSPGEETPLHTAAEIGKQEVVEFLLGLGADINATDKNGQTPLHRACWNGKFDVIQILLRAKANVHLRDRTEMTPLCIAAARNLIPLMQLLLANGASFMSPPPSYTPLHASASRGARETAEFTLQNMIDINTRDRSGQTPLFVACMKGDSNLSMIEFLLSRGAKVDLADNAGTTPLLGVCQSLKEENTFSLFGKRMTQGAVKTIRLLIQRGANLQTVNKQFETPINCIKIIKSPELNEAIAAASSNCILV